MGEEVMEKIDEPIFSKRRIIFGAILGAVLIIGVFLLTYSNVNDIDFGANIEAYYSSGNSAFIDLSAGANDENVTAVKFIFKSAEGTNYTYETSEGVQNISVPYTRFFFWKGLKGNYNYEINASELGLDSFDNVIGVEVVFVYLKVDNEGEQTTTETKPLDNRPTGTGSGSGSNGNSGSGSGTGTTTPADSTNETTNETNQTVSDPVIISASNITQHGITWYFNETVESGQFVNGDYWVVGPVTVVQITPEIVEHNISTDNYCKPDGWMVDRVYCNDYETPLPYLGEYNYSDECVQNECHYFVKRNGFMINKIPSYKHTIDSRTTNYDYNNDSLRVPFVLEVNSSLVSYISEDDSDFRGSWAALSQAAILTVVDKPVSSDMFRPGALGDKRIYYNSKNMNFDVLNNLAYIEDSKTPQELEQRFESPWVDFVPGWTGKELFATNYMPTYGSRIALLTGETALVLNLNYSIEEKKNLSIYYTQLGLDLYNALENGMTWPADGGHAPGRKLPIMFAGLIMGEEEMVNVSKYYPDEDTFQEDCQIMYLTAEIRDAYPDKYGDPNWYATPLKEGHPVYGIRSCQYDTGLAGSSAFSQGYRYNANTLTATVLAAHMMGLRSEWADEAVFDFEDYWMEEWLPNHPEHFGAYSSDWARAMWDEYRDDYGPLWTS